jgi:hypothetical protein
MRSEEILGVSWRTSRSAQRVRFTEAPHELKKLRKLSAAAIRKILGFAI